MSNAQVAAAASIFVGLIVIAAAMIARVQWTPQALADSRA
jgi:hypothetical protein